MTDERQKQHTNRVFKSLHKPLTYLGVERTLFYFVCVGAVGAFNLFNSVLAGIAVFIGGFAFGHWVTNSDPAFLRILARSERVQAALRPRETASPPRGGAVMLRLDRVASILKLDRAEKAGPEDREHDDSPGGEAAA